MVSREKPVAIEREFQAIDLLEPAVDGEQLLAGYRVPQSDGAADAGGGERLAVGRKSE
jgi:hypothetical protein